MFLLKRFNARKQRKAAKQSGPQSAHACKSQSTESPTIERGASEVTSRPAQSRAVRQLNPKKLEQKKALEEGGFGCVYSAYYRGKRVAYKSYRDDVEHDVRNEAALHQSLKHDHIIRFMAMAKDAKGMIMEFSEYGDLRTAIEDSMIGIDWELRGAKLIYDVVSALAYLKSQRVIHGDVKAENILLSTPYCAKLCDFNLSVRLEEGEERKRARFCSVNIAAPEQLIDGEICFASDIYALGITLWEMQTARVAWEEHGDDNNAKLQAIATGQRPTLIDMPDSPKWWVVNFWQQDPKTRPDIETVKLELENECKAFRLI